MTTQRNLQLSLLLIACLCLPAFAGLKRSGGQARSGDSDKDYVQKKIDGIRDAVDALRETLSRESISVQDAMQATLREVNAEAEQYISAIQDYVGARDDYYNSFDNTQSQGEDNDADDEGRRELHEKHMAMRAEQDDYYKATSKHLQALNKARRTERRRKPASQP